MAEQTKNGGVKVVDTASRHDIFGSSLPKSKPREIETPGRNEPEGKAGQGGKNS